MPEKGLQKCVIELAPVALLNRTAPGNYILFRDTYR
jgi:hypothetical protein